MNAQPQTNVAGEDSAMTTLFGTVLAAALLAQISAGTIEGTVVDDQGKPIVGAQIALHAAVPWGSKVEPLDMRATTDGDGRFRLVLPSARGGYAGRQLWASRAGLALAAEPVPEGAPRIMVLHKAAPKTIKIEGPEGRAVAGARISPRVISFPDRGSLPAAVPDALAESRAVTTGTNGTATLDYLAPGHQLAGVRVTAASIGTQDFPLADRPGREAKGESITLRLNPTSRLVGRVRARSGEPVAGQTVEVWFKGGNWPLESHPVGFENGPLRTAADGSFQTPDNLLVGSQYRVVVRAPEMEPILSEWLTIGEKPRVLLPLLQRSLRAINGRVVDRQGQPVVGVEVLQSGDGPERTSVSTDAGGRFMLPGFRHGPVCLFVRGEGFRFFGRVVKPGDHDVIVELTRTNERPARSMTMLGDPIPLEESRALARHLLEPRWKAIDAKNDAAGYPDLRRLVMVDPIGVLQRLDGIEFPGPQMKRAMLAQAAWVLARSDPAEAETVAATIDEPGGQARALVAVFDALPDQDRPHRLAVLERATLQANAGKAPAGRVGQLAAVAERWYELGEKEKAKSLMNDALRLAKTFSKATPPRRLLAPPLARFDLPSALAMAKEFAPTGMNSEAAIVVNIAFHLAADNPAEVERILSLLPPEPERDRFPPAVAWKMASTDPARARRLTDQSQQKHDRPYRYLFLALGLKSSDPAGASQAFGTAMQGIDRLMKGAEDYYTAGFVPREIVLPVVEELDPALVAEYFWRIVAARSSIGDPRSGSEFAPTAFALLLACYDRDAAALVFERVREWLEHADDRDLARPVVPIAFEAWSLIDPRAAVARLEQLPVTPTLDSARQRVAELLLLPYEARWRNVWLNNSYMADIMAHDLW
jgi:Carboxypeptidase regulatory-like domain